MKIATAEFLMSASNLEDCPSPTMPEFAFIGRSNVGKSSLINMLTSRKELAKTSSTPGKTRAINIFMINEQWRLVDLPGYGYAKVAKKEQRAFNDAVGEYFMQRKNLSMIFVLIDSRNEPQEIDLEFIQWLKDWKLKFALVFTKTDKVSQNVWKQNVEVFQNNLTAWEIKIPKVFYSSAIESRGRGPILQYIDTMLPKKPKKKAKGLSMASLQWAKKGK